MARTRQLSLTLALLSTAALFSAACASRAPSKGIAADSPSARSYQGGNGHVHAAPGTASVDRGGHVNTEVVAPQPDPNRPGLGTEFGETRRSNVERTRFVRASSTPTALMALHYNNESGVRAALDHHGSEMASARSYAGGGDVAVTITDSNGRALAGGVAGGRVYVVGHDGDRYNIEVRNDTRYRLEVVASVDGLDVIDGESASPTKRGYVVQPFSVLTIDGYRTSDSTVAAFRFGAVRDSYAARTTGDRNVGVIGIALFSERGAEWTLEEIRKRDTADPFPGYAKPPAGIAN